MIRFSFLIFALVFSKIQGAVKYELAGQAGSIQRISLTKAIKINRFISLTYPIYDASWSSSFYQKGDMSLVSYNGLVSIPGAIYEYYRTKANRDGRKQGAGLVAASVLALISVPVALGNAKLRFDRFEWIHFDTGFEADFFAPKKSNGNHLSTSVGVGAAFRRIDAGISFVQELLANEDIPEQSILAGKLSFIF